MLSYQHGYHAGNFADVVKHFTLCQLTSYLTIKEKPLLYLETHSGKGRYDLLDGQATKTMEHKQGVSLLWEHKNHLPSVFDKYIETISLSNKNTALRFYPGSPQFAIQQLRRCDRLIFSELHPREFDSLATLPKLGKKVRFSNEDGLVQLKAALPPLEKRGLIFIDPSYEIKENFRTIPQALSDAYKLFSTGTFCVWYPIIDKHIHEQFVRRLTTISANFLQAEFYLETRPSFGMVGCGMWVINPPFTLSDNLSTGLKYLKTIFNPGQSSFIIKTGE